MSIPVGRFNLKRPALRIDRLTDARYFSMNRKFSIAFNKELPLGKRVRMEIKQMAGVRFWGGMLVAGMLVVIMMAGCARFDTRDPRPPKLTLPKFSDGGLVNKVALSLFDNRTQLRFEEVEQSFYKPFNQQIKDGCKNLLLFTPYDPNFPEALVDATLVPERGALNNMAIAQNGRSLGLGAVITGRLANISGFEREKGFWLFKENQHYQRIMIQVDMYATETGAKILSEAYSQEIEINDTEFQALANGSVENSPQVMETFQEIAEDIAEDVCDILNDMTWIGFVTRVKNNTVTLSSGSEAGLVPGRRLELYSSDRIFQTPKGTRFFVPGAKTGEIEITAVEAGRARATLLPESKVGPGYTVRTR